MPKAKPFSPDTLARLRVLLRKARTKGQFKRVQCLWLRGALGLKGDQVAIALDWNTAAVRRLQARYLREGESALLGPGRGGRRHAGLNREQERALLARLAHEAYPNSVIESRQVQEALERAVGHHVSASAVYRLMARHSWRRAASGRALIPDSATRKLADCEVSAYSASQDPTAHGGDRASGYCAGREGACDSSPRQ